MSSRQTIVVKLELALPPGTAVQLGKPEPGGSPCGCDDGIGSAVMQTMSLQLPGLNSQVKVIGSGSNSGVICVRFAGDIDPVSRRPPVQVWAIVTTGTASCPTFPPTGAATTTTITPAGDWALASVGTAQSSASAPYPLNKLCIWRRYPNSASMPTLFSTMFYGIRSTKTDCEAWPAALPCHDDPPLMENVPKRQIVNAADFMGDDVSGLNGVWALDLDCGGEDEATWRSNGDGQCEPRVSLSVPVGCTGTCRLKFQLGGIEVRYDRDRSNWKPLGSNPMDTVWMAKVAEGSSVPTKMIVQPG